MSKTLIFYKNILKGGLDEIFLKAVFKFHADTNILIFSISNEMLINIKLYFSMKNLIVKF